MRFAGICRACESAADARSDTKVGNMGNFAAYKLFAALVDAPYPRLFWNEGADMAVVTGNHGAFSMGQLGS